MFEIALNAGGAPGERPRRAAMMIGNRGFAMHRDDTVVGALAASLAQQAGKPEIGAERGAHTGAPGGARDPDGGLFAELDGEAEAFARHAVPTPRRAGRPPGSPNRSTLMLQRWLMARGYRDPAEFLAALVSADTRELAAELAGRPLDKAPGFEAALEVLKIQRAAAAELLPYFHQRLPAQVYVKADGPRQLIVIGDLVAQKTVSNQHLGDISRDPSHDAVTIDAQQVVDLSKVSSVASAD
jgi:hypothetical protein